MEVRRGLLLHSSLHTADYSMMRLPNPKGVEMRRGLMLHSGLYTADYSMRILPLPRGWRWGEVWCCIAASTQCTLLVDYHSQGVVMRRGLMLHSGLYTADYSTRRLPFPRGWRWGEVWCCTVASILQTTLWWGYPIPRGWRWGKSWCCIAASTQHTLLGDWLHSSKLSSAMIPNKGHFNFWQI